MPRPQILFLDFDGVIMDSMNLKLDSYCYAFEGLGFSREAIHQLQTASAGLSRSKVIPLIYLSLTGKPMPEELFQKALARFTEKDEASREVMVLKEGTLDFLKVARELRVHMIVVTGTPKDVIDKTVAHFNLGVYFLQVCGSPGSKAQHLERLLGEYRVKAEDCLFVGDAVIDQEAAMAVQVPFIGVNNGDNPFRSMGRHGEIQNLKGLLAYL